MKRTLVTSAAGFALAVVVAGCGGSHTNSASQQVQRENSDKYEIEQVEAKWHKASSTKDLNLMMSLWAPGATFNIGTETLSGKAQIRHFFATKAGSFQPQNHWVSDTSVYKIRVTVNGDKGTLYFECHYIDYKTGKVASVVAADQNVQRIGGKWLITSSAGATPTLRP